MLLFARVCFRPQISILGSADFVVSEDTRRTGVLLKHFGISAKQMSHHEHNWAQKAPEIVDMAKWGPHTARCQLRVEG
jgi:16S rRNA (cytidine1402-2'-O)-methyltransferase